MKTQQQQEPILTTATLIHNVVRDLLTQRQFGYAHYPELVDVAVVATGLGMLSSKIGFVNEGGSFWDSTQWTLFPRPFLDGQSLAYVCALAAQCRGNTNPSWANDLPPDVKRNLQKSLKYLSKSHDSFFQFDATATPQLDQSQADWLELAGDPSASRQIVAVRHLQFDETLSSQQEAVLLEKLRSNNHAIVLNTIAATERMKSANDPVVQDLRLLIEERDDEVRAKALMALARLAALDEFSIGVAAKMLDGHVRHVVYAGLFSLSSLDHVPDSVIPPANRGFLRAMQTCNYEFVGLFAAAFNRWLEDPADHFEQMLIQDSPEYLEIALEALENAREQLVGLG